MSKTTLFLHIGLPKTGTTSLQHTLLDNHHILISNNILYPKKGIAQSKEYGPKHQLLFDFIRSNDLNQAEEYISEHSDLTKRKKLTSVVISHEGFTNHFYDLEEDLYEFINISLLYFKVVIVLSFKSLDKFFYSYYKQNIINPPINDELGYGKSLTAEEFLDLPRIQNILHYSEMLDNMEKNCKGVDIKVFDSSKNSAVRGFCQIIGLPYGLLSIIHHKNISLSDFAVEQTRKLNDSLKDNMEKRKVFLDRIRSKDQHSPSNFSLDNNFVNTELELIERQQLKKIKKWLI